MAFRRRFGPRVGELYSLPRQHNAMITPSPEHFGERINVHQSSAENLIQICNRLLQPPSHRRDARCLAEQQIEGHPAWRRQANSFPRHELARSHGTTMNTKSTNGAKLTSVLDDQLNRIIGVG